MYFLNENLNAEREWEFEDCVGIFLCFNFGRVKQKSLRLDYVKAFESLLRSKSCSLKTPRFFK